MTSLAVAATERLVEDGRTPPEGAGAEDILRWTFERFGAEAAVSSSFGAEDVVVIDLALRVFPAARIFTLDTGRLPEATFEVAEQVRRRWSCGIEVFAPDAADVEALERADGFFSFRESLAARHRCCEVRKVRPLARALAGRAAWITGLRREQSVTRTDVSAVELDRSHGGIVKVNPLVAWTNDDVWRYVRTHDLPYNRLHDQGYPSVGCAPCTRPVHPGEHPRAGRWWWELPEHKECGLHVNGDGI
ncbi:MAG: phosphoadenylyl-sulfate reductase [Deltaproteobacteria bacterium]|nr:phosphoadenylyl-sulfate reductase [Deltaproteobacteria bacterium]